MTDHDARLVDARSDDARTSCRSVRPHRWHRPAAVFGVSGRVYLDVGLVWNHADQLECVACPADVTLPPEHYINRFDNKGWVAGAPFR